MNDPSPFPTTPFSFTLQLGEEALTVSGAVPAEACPVTDLIPLLLGLGEAIVGAASRQLPSGKPVSCGPGCGACCRQLVPVSHAEAAFLREEVIPGLPPEQRARVTARVTAAAARLRQDGLLDDLRRLPAETDPERRQALGLRYFRAGLACPFLDDESCGIHPQRPLACREYLVVSPARCCAQPDSGGIEPVAIPRKPSHALIQLEAEAGAGPGWRTMIDALADADPPVPRMIPDPIEFLRNFLAHLLK